MFRASLLIALSMMTGCANAVIRGLTACETGPHVAMYAAPDSQRLRMLLKPYERVRIDSIGDGWTRIRVDHQNRYFHGWVKSTDVGMNSDEAYELATNAEAVRKREAVNEFLAEHPEMPPEMRAALMEYRIELGMPAEAATALYCAPDGVEDYQDGERRMQRLTWLGMHKSARTVITIQGGKIVAIRRGMGSAEDIYR